MLEWVAISFSMTDKSTLQNSIYTPNMAQRVKRLPAMQETWVRSLGWEDPLKRKWQPTPVLLPGKSQKPWGKHCNSEKFQNLELFC